MSASRVYAHTIEAAEEHWEPLELHLRRVAEGFAGSGGAVAFADVFGGADWARLLGWWHDLGKYSADFQAYLRATGNEAASETLERPGRVDHSTAGARHAATSFPGPVGRVLAYCIAGHHAGLPDDGPADERGSLTARLDPQRRIPEWSAAPPHVLQQAAPTLPNLRTGPTDAPFTLSVFCRMLFSALVDADFLATEHFMAPQRATQRGEAVRPAPIELLWRLDEYLAALQRTASPTDVNAARADVLRQCREQAHRLPGLFSLTVPTGGGKTLSSLAFALTHAVAHDLRRVIYAIPFTSIIEQNADVFRKALGDLADDALIEHHSNLDPEHESVSGRLAAENWDAPLIVTTNVQLFESLFACRPSACRKLHRVVRSVIVLDECQSLPVQLLKPTLAMLDELRRNYGCTIVFCTATQPAIKARPGFQIGLEDVHEIISKPTELASRLKRVEVERAGRLTDEELVERLASAPRALAIVNTRDHAARLFAALRERLADAPTERGGVHHLSAAMCAAHRTDVLTTIRNTLRDDRVRPCRVISTSLVEAGVDLDFPVVFRALAGLDAITQAAGRCNREGKLPRGRVVLFETDVAPPPYVRPGAQHTTEIIDLHSDLLGLEAIEHFFRLQYWSQRERWDANGILDCFGQQVLDGVRFPRFQFRRAAGAYQFIPDVQQPVLVPYGDSGRKLIEQLLRMPAPPGREFNRKLQRYVVNVYPRQLASLHQNQAVAPGHGGYSALTNPRCYDEFLGLFAAGVEWDPQHLIA